MAQPVVTRPMTDAEKLQHGVAGHPNRDELAEAINQGLTLHHIAQRHGRQVIDIAILLKAAYASNLKLPGLEVSALPRYMALRRQSIMMCEKAGVSVPHAPIPTRNPHKPQLAKPKEPMREEDTMSKPLAFASTMTRDALAGDLAAKLTVDDMAEKYGCNPETARSYLIRYGLLPPRRSKHAPDAPSAAPAPVGHSEAPGAAYPPEPNNDSFDPSTDKPAPQAGAGRGIQEPALANQTLGDDPSAQKDALSPEDKARIAELVQRARLASTVCAPTFACQITPGGIDISLSDAGLSPAAVRQYLRVVEGNLELAGDGLELHLTIRGPRR